MYALASLDLRWFLPGRRGTWCSERGRMYVLVSLGLRCFLRALAALQGVGCTPWRPLVSAALPVAFAWQGQHLVLCKGLDVRPGVPRSPLLFAWQARHMVLCKGSDVRHASFGLRRSAGGFCVAGAALGVLQGVGCTPWRPLVSGGFRVAGAALGALQRGRRGTWSAMGRMYAR